MLSKLTVCCRVPDCSDAKMCGSMQELTSTAPRSAGSASSWGRAAGMRCWWRLSGWPALQSFRGGGCGGTPGLSTMSVPPFQVAKRRNSAITGSACRNCVFMAFHVRRGHARQIFEGAGRHNFSGSKMNGNARHPWSQSLQRV